MPEIINVCNTCKIIWVKDWQAILTQRPEIKPYLSQHRTYTHIKKYLAQDQIIQYIRDGRLFGFVECDIEVPDHLKVVVHACYGAYFVAHIFKYLGPNFVSGRPA